MLTTFGVTPTTERVYRALLEHPQESIHELAARLLLGVDEVRSQFDALVEQELIIPEDSATAWSAIPPDKAIETLIAREEEAISARRSQLESSRLRVTEYVASFVANRRRIDADGLIEQIDSTDVVRSRLFQLSREAQRSAWSMLPGRALSPSATAASASTDRHLLHRGIAVRLIVSEVSLSEPHWEAYTTKIMALGAQVRVHPAPPQLAVLIDNEVAVVPRSSPPGALVLHGQDLAAPSVALFEEVWHAAEPLDLGRGGPVGEEQVSEARIRQVVTLLAQGNKDEAIARRMGVSVRTVRRMVSAAVEALHAQSRFQAGVLAVRKGWVDVGVPAERPKHDANL